jgi:hypothetical protein
MKQLFTHLYQLVRQHRLGIGLAAIAILGTVINISGGSVVQALSPNGPDAADYGNNARYALQATTQLRVLTSTVPVYYKSNPGTISVTVSGIDFERNRAPNARVSFNGQASINTATTFPLSGFTFDQNTGYFVALITANLVQVPGAVQLINYRLSIPGDGIIGTYAANASNSALANESRCVNLGEPACGRYYNYSMPFGTQCQAKTDQLVEIRIYDGDNGRGGGNNSVQPIDFTTRIVDETEGGATVPSVFSGSTGDGGTAIYRFTAKPYHKYRFLVNGVYTNNVMQINLPYDGIFYTTDCRSLERTDRIYGSWGEYGVMATGVIRGIGSGSAFAGRGLAYSTACSFTFLTIANATNANCRTTPAANFGGYRTGRTLPDVAARYPVASATATIGGTQSISNLSGVYQTSGALTLTGGSLPLGRTIVINTYDVTTRTYKDVTIAGDITYAGGLITSNNQIPQLVIIGGNINIQSGVRQVDSWLIASGTLNTCSNIVRTAITINTCNTLLTMNGPVMAKEVQLWRTAGSGNGDASGDPAEVFNLRPDAYLWGIAQSARSGRLETVYQRELPPRY